MSKKTVFFIIGAIILILYTIPMGYIPKHTWRAVSWDGYVDANKDYSAQLTTWKLIGEDVVVNEAVHRYSSLEKARKNFQEYILDTGHWRKQAAQTSIFRGRFHI